MNNAIKQNLSFTLIELLVVTPIRKRLRRFIRGRSDSSFTLVELLIVIGILAVLTTAVILAINPLEYLKQARDTTRISDLDSIDKSLAVLGTQGVTSFGTASTVYVSIADNASSTCGSLGLPTLPSGWLYHCVNSTNLQKVDSNGWIPVDFTQSPALSLAALPIDPINTASTGNYYTYTPGGSWELNTILESSKYRNDTNIVKRNLTGVYAKGSNLTLSPIYNTSGLVGYWKLDEGSGTVANDSSNSGYGATWYGSGTHYVSGKVGVYAGNFIYDNANYILTPSFSLSSSDNTLTFSGWFNNAQHNGYQAIFDDNAQSGTSGFLFMYRLLNSDGLIWQYADGANYRAINSSVNFFTGYDNTWTYITIVADYTNKWVKFYRNGDLVDNESTSYTMLYPSANRAKYIGSYPATGSYQGQLDDIRLYNRALSAAEIKAIYNATK